MHALNNFCEYLDRASFEKVLEEALFLSRTIRGKHLLRKQFDVLCKKRLGSAFSMVLYSKCVCFPSISCLGVSTRQNPSCPTYPSALLLTQASFKLTQLSMCSRKMRAWFQTRSSENHLQRLITPLTSLVSVVLLASQTVQQ